MVSLGREFGVILCECLGIDPNNVASATVYATPVDALTIDMELVVRPNTKTIEEVAKILRKSGHVVHIRNIWGVDPDPYQLGTARRELIR